jgi:hypothetical protein
MKTYEMYKITDKNHFESACNPNGVKLWLISTLNFSSEEMLEAFIHKQSNVLHYSK